MKPHQKLDAWKKSFFFVKSIYMITGKFPPDERFGLTSQMRRSAVSIPSNIAEGSGRNSRKDYNRFFQILIGSCFEAETQFLIARELNFGNAELINDQLMLITEEEKMLTAFSKSLLTYSL